MHTHTVTNTHVHTCTHTLTCILTVPGVECMFNFLYKKKALRSNVDVRYICNLFSIMGWFSLTTPIHRKSKGVSILTGVGTRDDYR